MSNSENRSLTQAQKRVLDFVRNYLAREGVPPTVREVAKALGFSSTNAAAAHLANLRDKGYLQHKPGLSRGYTPKEHQVRKRLIPILGRIAAGRPVFAEENLEGFMEADPFLLRGRYADTFVLRVEGDSMTGDGILPGDYIFVSRQPTANAGDIVVALIEDEATVKRFEPLPSGGARLIPSNPAYPIIEIRPQDGIRFEILGIVVGLYRRF